MRIKYTDKKTLELRDNLERILGHLAYDGLFSFKANAIVGNDTYRIVTKGFFDTTIIVSKNDVEVARIVMNWKGHFTITFTNGREFVLKANGPLLNKYVLEDKNQEKLLLLEPDFNWGNLSYNYTISYDKKPEDVLLVLLATYSATYCMAAAAS